MKMKEYSNEGAKSQKDYQPGEKQFAGKINGKANDYMSRTDAFMNKEAAKIKSQAYKGRYD